jgi:hypothetical protein
MRGGTTAVIVAGYTASLVLIVMLCARLIVGAGKHLFSPVILRPQPKDLSAFDLFTWRMSVYFGLLQRG